MPHSDNQVPPMMAAQASSYVRDMIHHERRDGTSLERAMERIANHSRMTFWQVSHLRKGNAKTIEAGLFHRIRSAYLEHCERQINALRHELEMERASNPDADLEDLAAAARELASQVVAKKKDAVNARR